MSKKYLLLCNRHNSVYGGIWCLFWGYRENKGGYTSDVRVAHRFSEDEIKEYMDDDMSDIPVPIDVLGLSENYEPEETYNKNLISLVEKSTLNRLMGLRLRPLDLENDNADTNEIVCPICESSDCSKGHDIDDNEVWVCNDCDYEFDEE